MLSPYLHKMWSLPFLSCGRKTYETRQHFSNVLSSSFGEPAKTVASGVSCCKFEGLWPFRPLEWDNHRSILFFFLN